MSDAAELVPSNDGSPEESPEIGQPVTLAYDLQWTLPPDSSGLSSVETTILFGDCVVWGSVND